MFWKKPEDVWYQFSYKEVCIVEHHKKCTKITIQVLQSYKNHGLKTQKQMDWRKKPAKIQKQPVSHSRGKLYFSVKILFQTLDKWLLLELWWLVQGFPLLCRFRNPQLSSHPCNAQEQSDGDTIPTTTQKLFEIECYTLEQPFNFDERGIFKKCVFIQTSTSQRKTNRSGAEEGGLFVMEMGGPCVEQETVRWPQIPCFHFTPHFRSRSFQYLTSCPMPRLLVQTSVRSSSR